MQIEPAEAPAVLAGNIGKEGIPFRTGSVTLGQIAPYLGRSRQFTRISAQLTARFAPALSTATAPETLRCVFEIVRFGLVEFQQVLELNRVMLLPEGVAFYEGNVTSDFNNPILCNHADTLAWRFVGVLAKQVVITEPQETVGVQEVTTITTVITRNEEGQELSRSVEEDTVKTTISPPAEESRHVESNTTVEGLVERIVEVVTLKRSEVKSTRKETPAAGVPDLAFAVGYELESV